jgi:hypothetical protein
VRLYRLLTVILLAIATAALGTPCAVACSAAYPATCGTTTLNTLTLYSQLNLGSWTTSTRPTSPVVGSFGYNATTGNVETWNGTAWVSAGGGGGSGTVTSVNGGTANGLTVSVTNPTTTPAIGVSTAISGLVKANGTGFLAATAGTDYLAPNGSGAALTGITAAQVGALSLTGGFLTGTLNSTGSFNTTSTVPFQVNGSTVLSAPNGGNALAVGVAAGVALPSNANEAVLIGPNAGAHLSSITPEVTADGWNACGSGTTLTFATCVGNAVLWNETSGNNAIGGGDAARDTVGMSQSAGWGNRVLMNGAGTGDTAFGQHAMLGNSSSALFGGAAPATGTDTVTLSFTCAGGPNCFSNTAIPITVSVGETTAQMASAMVAAVNANGFLGNGSATVGDTNSNLVYFTFPGTSTTGWQVTITPTVTGAETVTIGTGYAGQFNVGVGFQALLDENATTSQFNIGIGADTGPNCVTCMLNTFMQYNSGYNCLSCVSDVFDGQYTGYLGVSLSHSIALGDYSLYSDVSGANNIVIEAGASTTSNNDGLTGSASRNIVVGYQVAAPVASGNDQIDLGGVLSGVTSSGVGPGACVVGGTCIIGRLTGANLNTTGDQTIPIAPLSTGVKGYLKGATKYLITAVWVDNCSTSITAAQGGIYTASSKSGTAIVAATQAYTSCVSSTTMQQATLAPIVTSTVFSGSNLYLSLTTAQGTAATGDVYVQGIPFN